MKYANLVIFAALVCLALALCVSAEETSQQLHLASASESLMTSDDNVEVGPHARSKRWILKKLKRIINRYVISAFSSVQKHEIYFLKYSALCID